MLSKKTTKAYESAIERIGDRSAKDAVTWIQSQEWSSSYKKMTLSALSYREKQAERAVPSEVSKAIKDLAIITNSDEKKQKLTDKEMEKYLSWPSIIEARDKATLTGQNALIVALYTMTAPVRLDYTPMVVLYKTPTKAQIQSYKAAGSNICVLLKRTANFHFLNYKTATTYGDVKLPIPKALADVIRAQNIPNGSWLLSVGDQPMADKYLSERIRRIFHDITGKIVGVNILRHSYISWIRKGELPLQQKEALAKSMLHSPYESELYRKI